MAQATVWALLFAYVLFPGALAALIALTVRRFARWDWSWSAGCGLSFAFLIWSSAFTTQLPRTAYWIVLVAASAAVGVFVGSGARRQSKARIIWAVVIGITAFAVFAGLMFPFETHAVKLDMPAPS